MKSFDLTAVCAGFLVAARCLAQDALVEQANQLELHGQFKQVTRVLTTPNTKESSPTN